MTSPETAGLEAPLPLPTPPPARITRNFLLLSLTSVAGAIINLLLGLYSRHVFGTEVTGQLAWSSSVISYANLVVSPGLVTIARREVARDAKQAARYTVLLFVIQVVLAIVAFCLIQGFGEMTRRGEQIQLLLLFNAINLLFLPFDLGWLLQAHERIAPVSLMGIGVLAVQTAAVFAFIHGPEHVLPYLLLPYPFRLTFVAFTIWYALRHGFLDPRDMWPRFRLADVRPLIVAAIPVGMAQAMVMLYGNSDVIFLGMTHSDVVVGLYSTAYSMMMIPTFLHGALTNAYFSSLARAFETPDAARALSQQFLRLMIWIGFPLAALGWAIGRHPMLLILPGFGGSGPLLEWLCLNLSLMFFNVGYLIPLIAWEHQGLAFRCTLTGAVVNVGLNVWLIPHYGAQGAVLSTILAEAGVMVATILVRRRTHPLPWLRFVLFPALLCLLVGPAVRFATDHLMPWWCAFLLGALVLLSGCALVERDWTRAVLQRLRR